MGCMALDWRRAGESSMKPYLNLKPVQAWNAVCLKISPLFPPMLLLIREWIAITVISNFMELKNSSSLSYGGKINIILQDFESNNSNNKPPRTPVYRQNGHLLEKYDYSPTHYPQI